MAEKLAEDDITTQLNAYDARKATNNDSTKVVLGFFVYFVLIILLFFLIFSQQHKISLIESINKNSTTPKRKIETISPFPEKK
ncbi:unnamed protein product [marine sediment metagenome]|uniref:Uncharacterized protein n=1 Tax=marine sediment metagenome TaxID=412755 RepID=X1FGZ4_9ZZZZ